MRRAGNTLVEVLVVAAVTAVLVGLTLPGVQRVRATAARLGCQNNLRQLALALHGRHDAAGRLPPGTHGNTPASPRPAFRAWPVNLLPFLDQGPLDRLVQGTGADSLVFRRRPGLGEVLPPAGCPADGRTAVPWDVYPTPGNPDPLRVGLSSYLGNAGTDYRRRDGVLFTDSAVTLVGVTDGTSNTLLLGERPPSPELRFGWWHSGVGQAAGGSLDAHLGAAERNAGPWGPYRACPRDGYRFQSRRPDDPCGVFHFWSLHPGGANFALCDGSVRFLRYQGADLLPALATRAGGESAAVPD